MQTYYGRGKGGEGHGQVSQSDLVGGRGWPLEESSQTVEVTVKRDVGKPVKGKDGVVGWMTDYGGAVSKKVCVLVSLLCCNS